MKVIDNIPTAGMEVVKEELESHLERLDSTESSIIIISLNSSQYPRTSFSVRGRDRVKMVGAVQLALHDLTDKLIEDW